MALNGFGEPDSSYPTASRLFIRENTPCSTLFPFA
jgi:hypothetical protein